MDTGKGYLEQFDSEEAMEKRRAELLKLCVEAPDVAKAMERQKAKLAKEYAEAHDVEQQPVKRPPLTTFCVGQRVRIGESLFRVEKVNRKGMVLRVLPQ